MGISAAVFCFLVAEERLDFPFYNSTKACFTFSISIKFLFPFSNFISFPFYTVTHFSILQPKVWPFSIFQLSIWFLWILGISSCEGHRFGTLSLWVNTEEQNCNDVHHKSEEEDEFAALFLWNKKLWGTSSFLEEDGLICVWYCLHTDVGVLYSFSCHL